MNCRHLLATSYSTFLNHFVFCFGVKIFRLITCVPHYIPAQRYILAFVLHQIVHKHLCFYPKMLLIIITTVFLLSTHAHEASSRILHAEEQNTMNKNHLLGSLQQHEVHPLTITQKAFDGRNLSPLIRRLLRAYVPPSAPNPGTHIPASTICQTLASHNASAFVGWQQKSPLPSSLP